MAMAPSNVRWRSPRRNLLSQPVEDNAESERPDDTNPGGKTKAGLSGKETSAGRPTGDTGTPPTTKAGLSGEE